MLACAPDEEHELPLVALAAALAERGIATTLLGARTPSAAPTAAASLEGGLLVVFALLPQRVPEDVQDPPPNAEIVAAGPGWDPTALPPRVRYVNSLPEAVTLCTHRPARRDVRTAMNGAGPDPHRTAHIEVFGALDADALAMVIRLAHSTIRSGCGEVLLQLQALTEP